MGFFKGKGIMIPLKRLNSASRLCEICVSPYTETYSALLSLICLDCATNVINLLPDMNYSEEDEKKTNTYKIGETPDGRLIKYTSTTSPTSPTSPTSQSLGKLFQHHTEIVNGTKWTIHQQILNKEIQNN